MSDRRRTKVVVHTLTVDSPSGIDTDVFLSEAAALRYFFDTFDPDGEYGGDLQAVMTGRELCVYLAEHHLYPRPGEELIA